MKRHSQKYLFETTTDHQMSVQFLDNSFSRYQAGLGISKKDRITPHHCRLFIGDFAVAEGGDQQHNTQLLLKHSTSTMRRYYNHAVKVDKSRSAAVAFAGHLKAVLNESTDDVEDQPEDAEVSVFIMHFCWLSVFYNELVISLLSLKDLTIECHHYSGRGAPSSKWFKPNNIKCQP